jgi:hypothetical protein
MARCSLPVYVFPCTRGPLSPLGGSSRSDRWRNGNEPCGQGRLCRVGNGTTCSAHIAGRIRREQPNYARARARPRRLGTLWRISVTSCATLARRERSPRGRYRRRPRGLAERAKHQGRGGTGQRRRSRLLLSSRAAANPPLGRPPPAGANVSLEPYLGGRSTKGSASWRERRMAALRSRR